MAELTDSSDVESKAEKTMEKSMQQLALSSDVELDDDDDDGTTLQESLQQLKMTLDSSSSDTELDVKKKTLNDSLLQLATWMMRSTDQADVIQKHIASLFPLSAESQELLINLDKSLSRPGADSVRRFIDNVHILVQESNDLYERFKLTFVDYSSKRYDVKYRRLLYAIIKENVTKIRQVEEQMLKIDKEVKKRDLLKSFIMVSDWLNDDQQST